MNTALILGANGRFGGATETAFRAAGWRVVAQVRRPRPGGTAIALEDTAALAQAAAGARVVVHAVNPLYTRWDAEAMPALRHSIAVAQRLGARFVLPGNVYNFGDGMPARLDARTPQRPTTAKGRMRVAMEDEIRASGLDAVVLRAGDFFGGGTGSWLDLVIAKDIARGHLVYPGPQDVLHAWAYLPDLARACVALAAAELPAGFHDLPFAGHAVTGREFIGALQQAAAGLGIAPARWRVGGMPWPLLRVAGLVWPMGRELARMSYLWRVPHALDGTALQAIAGPLPATPLVAALRDALLALGHGRAAGAPVSSGA